MASAIVQSSHPVLWYLIRVNRRRQTEMNAKVVKIMTMCLHKGPRSSALSAAISSGEN